VQNYTQYGRLWRFMQRFPRGFQQTRPTELHNDDKFVPRWEGTPEDKLFLRMNDYSQAYKQWCVLRLVDTHHIKYDLYFRLRPDLRTVALIFDFKWVPSRSTALALPAEGETAQEFKARTARVSESASPPDNSSYPLGSTAGRPYNVSFMLQRYKAYYKVKSTVKHSISSSRIHVNNF
jgi:hypothetical protein